jgi:cbb3-type cytochrome oxidase maturation protein
MLVTKLPFPVSVRREAMSLESIWYLLGAGATMGMFALIAFLWGVKNGAFENAEDAKYIVFRDEDDDD